MRHKLAQFIPLYPAVSSTIDLGSTSVGNTITNTAALTITNTGTGTLSVSFGFLGGDLSEFGSAPGPQDITGGASVDISLSCTPTVAAQRATTLRVVYNATGTPSTYPVICTGTAPQFSSTPAINGTTIIGTTDVGTTVTNTAITITNVGSEDLDLSFNISGTNASDFSMVTPDQSVTPTVSLPVSVSCTPSAAGIRVATLSVTHNDPTTTNPASYTLNCTGTAPIYGSTPASGQSIPLGQSQVGSPTTNATALTITNTGTANLDVDFSISGGDVGDFTINTSPTTQTISTSGILSISLTCTPSAIGMRSTTLTVNHNAAGTPATYTVQCDGIATGTPIYSASPASGTPIDFGNVTVNTSSVNANAVVINNTGTAPLNVFFDLSGGDAADFQLNTSDTTVYPGVPLNVSITCTPSVVGLRTTTFTVNHNAAGSPAIYAVNCTGTPVNVPIYDSTPAPGQPIDLGSSTVGSSVTNIDALIINNTGTATMNVASFAVSGTNAADFVVNTGNNQNIAAGGNLHVSITCTPGATGARSATLTVSHDAAGSPATYPLACTGTPPGAPGYGSNPAPGATLTISTAPSVAGTATVTISETGGGPLTVSYSISGSAGTLSVSWADSTLYHQ